jgi:hypothetical protein
MAHFAGGRVLDAAQQELELGFGVERRHLGGIGLSGGRGYGR